MNADTRLLLEVWREVCRHLQIAESLNTIARLLGRRLAVDRLVVRRIDVERGTVETVAAGPDDHAIPTAERIDLAPGAMKRLVNWTRRGELISIRSNEPAPTALRDALPSPTRSSRLVGPLTSQHGSLGLLTVDAPSSHHFNAEQQALVRSLLDPLAVALDNDHRLRELNALREAAEADTRSLLTRLGRENLSNTIVGADAGLRPVMQRVELVAASDAPVLILGETGSGKEVIARHIHTHSPRIAGPFMRVNCGAISPELIDSELFGHEKGAFTGATATRRGWFERADEGTLFLDEIGELPPAAQVRLLRVLQDGTFERVGGETPVKVDVRIVAATHRDLPAMAREGRFREDLWYRIAVFPVVLPPLRERLEDIAALAEHFARRAATRFGLMPQSPTNEDVTLLLSYAWPGNVRELASVMDRAAILGEGRCLEVAKALGAAGPLPPTDRVSAQPASTAVPQQSAAVLPIDEAMRRHITAALTTTHGRIDGPFGAAKLLNINPHTLRARMRKLNIDWRRHRIKHDK